MDKTRVAIIKGREKPSESQIEANVRKAVELVGGLDSIKSGDTVIIKPNVCSPAPQGSAQCTNPVVAKTVAAMVRETGGTPIIAESSGVLEHDTELAFRSTGYDKFRAEGYEVIDLKAKKTILTKVPIRNGKVIKEVTLPKIFLDAKLVISVPVMKTHSGQKVTLSLKNMKGMLPDVWKKKLHTIYGVAPGLIDVLSVVRPGLAVVDGILAQEGLGPIIGTPVEMGLIIAGKDAVAVDAVTSKVMGFDPKEIPLIDGAAKAGIGTADLNKIEVVGASIKEVQRRFKRVEEAVEEAIPPSAMLQVLIEEKACTGCRECVLAAIHSLNEANKLHLLKGWTVLAGQTQKIPEANKENLLLVGLCTAKYKKSGIFVPGCPPWPWDIIEASTGEKNMASGIGVTEAS